MTVFGLKSRIQTLDLDIFLFLDKAENFQENSLDMSRSYEQRLLSRRMMDRCLAIAIRSDEEMQVLKHELKQAECNQ